MQTPFSYYNYTTFTSVTQKLKQKLEVKYMGEYDTINVVNLDILYFIESHVNHGLNTPCFNQLKPIHFPLPHWKVA